MSGGVRHGAQDGAAALLRDGQLVAAIEEERLLTMKHAVGLLPERAIRACLKVAGIGIQHVDLVATHGESYPDYEEVLGRWFRMNFGYCPPIRKYNHHLAHCASAYYASGFDDSMVFSTDLSGDLVSTMLGHAKDGDIDVLQTFRRPNSLGVFYCLVTQFLGFRRDSDEYKVMGLSSYGRPTIDLSWLLQYDRGEYCLNQSYLRKVLPGQSNPSKQEPMYEPSFLEKMGRPRLDGEPMNEFYEDVAMSAQRLLENTAVHMIERLHQKTASRSLCVAGGVGLNCVMNQRLLALPFIDRIFVQPAASDAGVALGAAYLAARQNGESIGPFSNAYLGVPYSEGDIRAALDLLGVPYRREKNITEFATEQLAAGKIMGLFQGADEYGPRALGNRSILANPRDPCMKDLVNERIKFRETFRPFAPSILEEHAPAYLKGYKHPARYMTLTFDVVEEKQPDIAAVVHVDGTARAQTVSPEENPFYYNLIRSFHQATGIPALLNTSFNVKGQTIVHNPVHAVGTFYGSGMDHLLIPPFVLSKR
jgi:carbamoyltransferase